MLNPFKGYLWNPLRVVLFFHLVCFGWILFRAESLPQAWLFTKSLASGFGPGIMAVLVQDQILLFMGLATFLTIVQIVILEVNFKSSRISVIRVAQNLGLTLGKYLRIWGGVYTPPPNATGNASSEAGNPYSTPASRSLDFSR